MKRRLTVALAATLLVVHAEARIGETPEQLEQRYGAPTKKSIDVQGYGLGVYRSTEFNESRVTFVKGRSQLEQYKTSGNGSVSDSAVERLKRENPDESVLTLSWGVEVGTPEPESELKFVRHSQEEHTYSGTGRYKDDGQARWFVLRDGNATVEIPLWKSDPALLNLKRDTSYDVTVLDEEFEDLQVQIAIVGHREHVDWDDAVNEAHSSFQQLVRISTAGMIVFDRSVCRLHHVKMERRNVNVAYGMLEYSKAESYCIAHYPNFRDYAVGGCNVGDTKSTPIYICPKCVLECNEYKRQRPEEKKNPLD
jgi:hypothetical protein